MSRTTVPLASSKGHRPRQDAGTAWAVQAEPPEAECEAGRRRSGRDGLLHGPALSALGRCQRPRSLNQPSSVLPTNSKPCCLKASTTSVTAEALVIRPSLPDQFARLAVAGAAAMVATMIPP